MATKKHDKGVKAFKVEPGYVWCDKHGCIHDDTLDPYEMGGEAMCQPHDRRPVYVQDVSR